MKINTNKILFLVVVSLIVFTSCEDDSFNPRPYGYFRIDMNDHEYQNTKLDCPYYFEYSKNAFLIKKNPDLCWYNIYYPKHKATVYLTYISLDGDFKDHLDQTQKLTYEHQIKASKIERIPFSFPDRKVYGLKYRLSGEVASSIQFYLTDSTDNFIRGALYFNSIVNSDSLKPVIDYLDIEIEHLTNTLRWN